MPSRPPPPGRPAAGRARAGAAQAANAARAAVAAASPAMATRGSRGERPPPQLPNVGTPAAKGFLASKRRRSGYRAPSRPEPAAGPRSVSAPANAGTQKPKPVAGAAAAAVSPAADVVRTAENSLGSGAARVGDGGRGSPPPGLGLQGSQLQPSVYEGMARAVSADTVDGQPAVVAAMNGGEPSALHQLMISRYPTGGGDGGGDLKRTDLAAVRQQQFSRETLAPPATPAAPAAAVSATQTRYRSAAVPTAPPACEKGSSSDRAAAEVAAATTTSNAPNGMPASASGRVAMPWEGSARIGNGNGNGNGRAEPWDEEEEANGGAAQAGGGGGQGRAASGGGGGGEVDAWAVSPSRAFGGEGGEIAGFHVEEKANPIAQGTTVLLLEESEGASSALVGVEFSAFRLSLAFDRQDDAIVMLASLLYHQPCKYRVLSSKPPHTRGHTSAVPAPFVASLGPFGEAGLECADLIYCINGAHFGEDRKGEECCRWWENKEGHPAKPGLAAAAATADAKPADGVGGRGGGGGGSGVANGGDDGGGGPAAAPPGHSGGKENGGAIAAAMQLPFVELLVLRATGETSNTTTHAGSLAAQKDWVALRLLQQQQSLVTARVHPQFSKETPLSQENLEAKNRALANCLAGDAAELSARLERSVILGQRDEALPPTAVAAKIKESMLRLTQLNQGEGALFSGSEPPPTSAAGAIVPPMPTQPSSSAAAATPSPPSKEEEKPAPKSHGGGSVGFPVGPSAPAAPIPPVTPSSSTGGSHVKPVAVAAPAATVVPAPVDVGVASVVKSATTSAAAAVAAAVVGAPVDVGDAPSAPAEFGGAAGPDEGLGMEEENGMDGGDGGSRGRSRVGGLLNPRCLDELLDCLVEHRDEDGRPILYLNDDAVAAAQGVDVGGGLPIQDEWDEREMSNRRLSRRRRAQEQAEAEISLWGCETDAVGQALPSGGEELGGAAAEGVGVDSYDAQFVPFEPACDEEWQVAEPLPPGRKMVRQLMHVNGVEADELTLAELHASVLSEDALSLAQEGDTAAVSYAICHVSILVDPAAASAASAAAAQAAAAAQPRARPASPVAAALAQAVGQGSVGRASSPPLAAGGAAVGAGENPPFPSPMEVDAPISAAANGITVSTSATGPTATEVVVGAGRAATTAESSNSSQSRGAPSVSTALQQRNQAREQRIRMAEAAKAAQEAEEKAAQEAEEKEAQEAEEKEAQEAEAKEAQEAEEKEAEAKEAEAKQAEAKEAEAKQAQEAKAKEVQEAQEAEEKEAEARARAEALRRRNDPEVKAKRKAAAEAAAVARREGTVVDPRPGLVVWAERSSGTDLWPSLIQENLPHDRCIIRFLGTPPSPDEAAPLTKEVDSSSLVKFPGGQRLMVLTERLPPLGPGAKKEDRDAHITEEFLLPANEENRRLQLAIDQAVRLCIIHLWDGNTATSNVLDTKALDKLGLEEHARLRERRNRLEEFTKRPGQWISEADTRSSRDRFRVMMNNKKEGADPLCVLLRSANKGVQDWIKTNLESREPPSSAPTAPLSTAAASSSSAAQRSTSNRGKNAALGAAASPPSRGEAAKSTANGVGRPDNKLKRPRGASGASEEDEGSIDDTGSDHADTNKSGGKGKAKRGRNSAASRGGESPAVSVEADEGVDGEFGDADDGTEPSSELESRKESKKAYTTEELVARLNLLYSKAGLTLDVSFYNTVLDERAKKDDMNAPAESPSSATEGDGADKAEANSRRGNGGAAAKGNGKRKAPGGSEVPDSSARVASNERETDVVAAGSSELPQQPTAKRRKEDAADDDGGDNFPDDFSCGGGGGGGGGSDSDEGSAPSPPCRPPSSRREGASKPALERAKVRASLGKHKVGVAKLGDKIPAGAAVGQGASYLIPKKTAAAAPTTAPGGGSVGGGGMRTIPKKPFPNISRSSSGSSVGGTRNPPPAAPARPPSPPPPPPPHAGAGAARTSNNSSSPGGGGITRESSGSNPRSIEGGGGSRGSPPPEPIPEDLPEAIRGLEDCANHQDDEEEYYRRGLARGGAYLGTSSRTKFWKELQKASDKSNGYRERKLEIIKAVLDQKAEFSSDDNSDDDGDGNLNPDDASVGGSEEPGGACADGRGRFGMPLHRGVADSRVRPPTPPLPAARGQPKMSSISPRADARPIGECKSSWGGDQRGGRGRPEPRVIDARVPLRSTDSSGGSKGLAFSYPSGSTGKKHPPPPQRVAGSPSGSVGAKYHPPPQRGLGSPNQHSRGVLGGSPTSGKVPPEGGKSFGSSYPSGGIGTKYRPPPPRDAGSPSQQSRGVVGGSPTKFGQRPGGRGTGGSEFHGSPRDSAFGRSRVGDGAAAGRIRGINRRDSRDRSRSESRERGSGARLDRERSDRISGSRREKERSDRIRHSKKVSGGRPGSADDPQRERSRGERDRPDGNGVWRPSSSSSRADKEERERYRREKERRKAEKQREKEKHREHKEKQRERHREKERRKQARRSDSRDPAAGSGEKHRRVSGESSNSFKRRRSSDQEGYRSSFGGSTANGEDGPTASLGHGTAGTPLAVLSLRTPAGPHATAAADSMAPPTSSSWTVPEGQPPPPDGPPPPHDGPPPLPDGPPPPHCPLSVTPSAPQQPTSPPQPTPPHEREQPSFTHRSDQQRPPPGLPPTLAPPPHPPTPRASSNHNDHGNGGAQNNLRSWDDDMDLDDAGTPSPGTGRQEGGNGGRGAALRPPQPPPPRENSAPAGPPPPMPGPPPMPPQKLQPQQLPTMRPAPPAPAVPHPRQQVFAPPVFTPPPYAHAGPATAAATATPAVIATSAPPNFHVVHGGVGLGAPSAATAAPASTAGTGPAPVTLPLGSVARPPAVITTARTGAAATGGPPLFSPQELDAAAMAINNARATLAMRRENPTAPATPTFIPENPAHPGGQQFHPVRNQSRERRGSHDYDDGSRQHQHQAPPPPPYHSWGPG